VATVRLARYAMAARFEIVLHGDNEPALRAAGEEALDEIEGLEGRLSFFRPASEIARLNMLAAQQPVRVTPGLFALLERAQFLSEETGGAFDITIAPLVRCWGFMEGSGRLPDAEGFGEARGRVGMHLVQLDPRERTVRFARSGVMLDLGAIGKGYAIERAAETLREAGVSSALLHGGTSSIYAIGRPPNAEAWQVSIEDPARRPDRAAGSPDVREPFAVVGLNDESLSVSAIWGKFFQAEGETLGHIIDPRTGRPATNAILAAVILPSATDTDALSTALLTLGLSGLERLCAKRPGIRALVVAEAEGRLQVRSKGIHHRAAG
jgi:thiamine biosynthesis lipoprotein